MTKNKSKNMLKNGRANKDFKHVRLYKWLLESPAWRSLSTGSKALYIELSKLYNGYNNGEIFLSVRDAGELLNVTKNTVSKFFKELTIKGFIKCNQQGSFEYKKRHATTWILTEHEYEDKTPTKEFMSFKKEKSVPKIGTDSLKN